jgi:hypothetical protein
MRAPLTWGANWSKGLRSMWQFGQQSSKAFTMSARRGHLRLHGRSPIEAVAAIGLKSGLAAAVGAILTRPSVRESLAGYQANLWGSDHARERRQGLVACRAFGGAGVAGH